MWFCTDIEVLAVVMGVVGFVLLIATDLVGQRKFAKLSPELQSAVKSYQRLPADG